MIGNITIIKKYPLEKPGGENLSDSQEISDLTDQSYDAPSTLNNSSLYRISDRNCGFEK